MSAALSVSVLVLPLLLAVTGPSTAAAAPAPAPRQKAPVQFRCETGAVWMENCNECRCQSDNHVVCAHLACLRNAPAEAPAAPVVAAVAAAAPGGTGRDRSCYQGICPEECDNRLDESGCHICDCGATEGDVTAMLAPGPGETRRWSFLSVARSLRHDRP